MKKEYKIILEIITAIGVIFGLYKGGLIGKESAIVVGVILFSLILCFQNLRQEIKDELNPIKNALAEIQKFLKDNFNFSPLHKISTADKYGIENSPMKPNDEGKRLLRESGFDELYPKIKNKIFLRLDGMRTRTLYDAEENVKVALEELSGDPLFDDVKNYVVNHHAEPLKTIFMVSSWVIRDDYAKEKNIIK